MRNAVRNVAFGSLLILGAHVAQAQKDPYYLTTSSGSGSSVVWVVQNGIVQNHWLESGYAAAGSLQNPIAVYGDVRTDVAATGQGNGYDYSLSGTPLATYASPTVVGGAARDGSTDGTHNFYVTTGGDVYETNRDWSGATYMFTSAAAGLGSFGISYDAANNSIWVSNFKSTSPSSIYDYSLGGSLQSSFTVSQTMLTALAYDNGDGSLWYQANGNIYQVSTTGVAGSEYDNILAGQTDLAPRSSIFGGEFSETPEPATLGLFATGLLGLGGAIRRRRAA